MQLWYQKRNALRRYSEPERPNMDTCLPWPQPGRNAFPALNTPIPDNAICTTLFSMSSNMNQSALLARLIHRNSLFSLRGFLAAFVVDAAAKFGYCALSIVVRGLKLFGAAASGGSWP